MSSSCLFLFLLRLTLKTQDPRLNQVLHEWDGDVVASI